MFRVPVSFFFFFFFFFFFCCCFGSEKWCTKPVTGVTLLRIYSEILVILHIYMFIAFSSSLLPSCNSGVAVLVKVVHVGLFCHYVGSPTLTSRSVS